MNGTATQLLYSTLLGGNSGEGIFGIAVDTQGKIHVAGNTTSSTFLTTANAWDRLWANYEDVFYSKIDPLKAGLSGLMYSTFLGGANRDFGEAIAIDKNGRAWITGRTNSIDFPTVQPGQATNGGDYDVFIAEIDPAQSGAASLLFSTYRGGTLYEEGSAVAVDPSGYVYVADIRGPRTSRWSSLYSRRLRVVMKASS